MELELKIRKVGTSNGVIIPAYVMKYLEKKDGDTIKIKITEKRKGGK